MSDAPQQPPSSPGAPRPPNKKDIALMLLEGPSVFIHLDPRKPGVVVPQRFMTEPQLMLQVGLNMSIAIPDLKVDDDGITCTLSFRQRPFWCSMPWSAIYALVGEDNRGMVWPNDVPPEIATQLQGQPGPKPAPARKPRPKLAAVPSEPEVSEASEAKDPVETDETSAPEAATGTTRKKGRDEPKRGLSAVPPGPAARATRGASGGRSRGGNAARIDEPEPPRPSLVAVPPAEPSGAGEKRGPMAPVLASEDEGQGLTPVPPRRPELVPGKKPKRELPPYLRVIK